ncbi:hypothetical protein EV363DRAFT_1386753, partial [Boletus edulis]
MYEHDSGAHHSERDTSSVGHAGAGIFWDDAWLLVVTYTSTSTPSLEWKSLRVEGTTLPEPRGWFPPRRTFAMKNEGRTHQRTTLIQRTERS